MSKRRLQVLIEEKEYRALQKLARESSITVGEWVRQALRKTQQDVSLKSPDHKLKALQAAMKHSIASQPLIGAKLFNRVWMFFTALPMQCFQLRRRMPLRRRTSCWVILNSLRATRYTLPSCRRTTSLAYSALTRVMTASLGLTVSPETILNATA